MKNNGHSIGGRRSAKKFRYKNRNENKDSKSIVVVFCNVRAEYQL